MRTCSRHRRSRPVWKVLFLAATCAWGFHLIPLSPDSHQLQISGGGAGCSTVVGSAISSEEEEALEVHLLQVGHELAGSGPNSNELVGSSRVSGPSANLPSAKLGDQYPFLSEPLQPLWDPGFSSAASGPLAAAAAESKEHDAEARRKSRHETNPPPQLPERDDAVDIAEDAVRAFVAAQAADLAAWQQQQQDEAAAAAKAKAIAAVDAAAKAQAAKAAKAYRYISGASIVSLYFGASLLFAGVWIYYFWLGKSQWVYMVALSFTLIVNVMLFGLASSFLERALHAPNAITLINGVALAMTAGVWAMVREPSLGGSGRKTGLIRWVACSMLFAACAMVNQKVFEFVPVELRMVFQNFFAVVLLGIEVRIMPDQIKPRVTYTSVLALFGMLVGAILFVVSALFGTGPSTLKISIEHMVVACLLVIVLPSKLLRRWFLSTVCRTLPVGTLSMIDGFIVMLPSTFGAIYVGCSNRPQSGIPIVHWESNGEIIGVIIVSMCTFITAHVCSSLQLRAGPATSYGVLLNISGFLLALGSWLFSGQSVASQPVKLCGLLLSLVCGLAYTIESQQTEMSRESEQPTVVVAGKNQDDCSLDNEGKAPQMEVSAACSMCTTPASSYHDGGGGAQLLDHPRARF